MLCPYFIIQWARVPKDVLREGLEHLHPAGVSGPYHPLNGDTDLTKKTPQIGSLVGARGLEPPDLTDVNRAL